MNPDGSGVRLLTFNVRLYAHTPAWSPDSARIAFSCQVEANNWDICAMNRDGTGFVRLTTSPAADWSPVWSPNGTKIVFSTDRFGSGGVLALMNPDGSGISQIGRGIQGSPGSWSPDGAQIAFTAAGDAREVCTLYVLCTWYTPPAIYTTTPDGAVVTQLVDSGRDPAWMPMPVPVATFTFACNGSTCEFDASGSRDSYGTITGYAWNFGDGTTGAGARLTHSYPADGGYTVTLTVTDSNGATGTKIQPITTYPVASFTSSCNVLTCSFDGSVSQGNVWNYAWTYGDGLSGTGMAVSHTGTHGGRLCRDVDGRERSGRNSDRQPAHYPEQPACRGVHVHVPRADMHIQRVRLLGSRWNDRELRVEFSATPLPAQVRRSPTRTQWGAATR